MAQLGCGNNRRILDADLVVGFVAFAQAAQDGDGVLDIGLADVDDLEAALKRGVFFDVLAVLIQRGGTDGAEFAAGEGRLEHIGGIDGAFSRAGADEGVEFVDEEDELAVRLFDFLEHGLEAVFKLAAELGTGEHGAEIERDDALVAQDFGDVTQEDAAREAFDDGGLADAGFANEDGVIFCAAREHLNDAADLLVAADDGVKFAAAGELGEVFGVLGEGLELAFGVLVGDALGAADGFERVQDGVIVGALGSKSLGYGLGFLCGEGEQEVFGGDKFVFEVCGFLESPIENF